MNKPQQRVVLPKSGKPKKARAESPQDWDKQEAEEAQREKPRPEPDEINRIIGSALYQTNYSAPDWTEPRVTKRHRVSRWYPHKHVGVDFPRTESEGREKEDFFAARGIKVLVVQVGQVLDAARLARMAKD